MADKDLDLAQLLCTRLCHDLAGPVGAVAAGVELIGGDPTQADEETLGLIGDSSAAASRKLKFLRAALGVAKGPVEKLDVLLDGYLSAIAGPSGKVAATWPEGDALRSATDALGESAGQLILNLLMTALEMQPGCRTLSIEVREGQPLAVEVIAEGAADRGFAQRDDIIAATRGQDGHPLTAKNVQAHMLGRLTAAMGGTVECTQDEQRIRVAATFPNTSS